MFTAIVRLSCSIDQTELIERAYTHAGRMDNVRGFVSSEFLRKAAELEGSPNVTYLAISRWENRSAYESWTKTESFDAGTGTAAGSQISARVEFYDVMQA